MQPRASKAGIVGLLGEGDDARLKVSITAAPVDGKANAALLKLLARKLGVSPSRLAVLRGATGRAKDVFVADLPVATVRERLLP